MINLFVAFQELIVIVIAIHDPLICGPAARNTSTEKGTLNLSATDLITSPSECLWTVTAPHGKKVKLTVSKFLFTVSMGCTTHRMLMFDGTTERDPKLGELCFRSDPKTFTSKGFEMLVKFTATGISLFDELEAQYEEINGIEKYQHDKEICGDAAINIREPILLWNIPLGGRKAANKQCRWRFYADRGKRVQITVNDISFSGTPSCQGNRLEFFEGTSEEGAPIATICNNSMKNTFSSKGNEMFVKFVAFYVKAGEGFKASYRQTSGAPRLTLCDRWILSILLAILHNKITFLYNQIDNPMESN